MYHNGRSYKYYVEDNKDFVPKFLDETDQALLAEAKGHCNGSTNLPCLFDFVYTRNAELASQTLETEQQAQITAEELGINEPSQKFGFPTRFDTNRPVQSETRG